MICYVEVIYGVLEGLLLKIISMGKITFVFYFNLL